MVKMKLGNYVLATLREADYDNREREGFYWESWKGKGRVPLAHTLEEAKQQMLGDLPMLVRPFVVFEGTLD